MRFAPAEITWLPDRALSQAMTLVCVKKPLMSFALRNPSFA